MVRYKGKLLNRTVYSEIVKWAERARRKPLVLMGARQVGKTWLMDALARERFACNPPFAIKSSLRDYSWKGSVRSLPLYALGLRISHEIGLDMR